MEKEIEKNKPFDVKIVAASEEDAAFVDRELVMYNNSCVPFTQKPAFESINRVLKNAEGEIVGGIICTMYCWRCFYIDVLWVKDSCRNSGYGSLLLQDAETIAREKECGLIHLDTFDFQAKDFYLKHGYEIFGELRDCPPGHARYYMKKTV